MAFIRGRRDGASSVERTDIVEGMHPMASRAALALVLAGLLAGACSAPRVPLIAYDPGPPDASPAGTLLEGQLGVRGASPCVVMLIVGEAPIGLAWPPGYTATFNPLRVFNETGLEVATEGVAVTLGGEISFEPSAICATRSSFRVDQVFKGTLPPAP